MSERAALNGNARPRLCTPQSHRTMLRAKYGEAGLAAMETIIDDCVREFQASRSMNGDRIGQVVERVAPDWDVLDEYLCQDLRNTVRLRLAEALEKLRQEFQALEFSSERKAELEALTVVGQSLQVSDPEPIAA